MTYFILVMMIVLDGETHPVPIALGGDVLLAFYQKAQCEAAAKALEPAVKAMLNKAATLTSQCIERKGPDSV